ncbi:MAG: glycosyltransferase [Planctomycetota bacterium]
MSGARPGVTLFMPTWNAGPEFPGIFARMASQELDRPFEILVIDSGSRDGTVEFLERQDVRLIRIPNTEFNHGLTRNRGIQEARGDIVVLATQDARPFDEHWMQRLVDCYEDPEVAGAYSRQLPRPDANPFIKDRLSSWAAAGEEPRVQRVGSREEFEALPPLEKLARVAFDNVSSSVRRSVALEVPFRERQFGEDLDWGHRAVLAGHKVVFEPRSKVVHSHNNSIWYEFKRVYLDHQNLNRIFGVQTVARWRDVLTCGVHATGHLFKVVERERGLGPLGKLLWWLKAAPFGFSQNLAQFLGARSVRKLAEGDPRYTSLDRVLRKGV